MWERNMMIMLLTKYSSCYISHPISMVPVPHLSHSSHVFSPWHHSCIGYKNDPAYLHYDSWSVSFVTYPKLVIRVSRLPLMMMIVWPDIHCFLDGKMSCFIETSPEKLRNQKIKKDPHSFGSPMIKYIHFRKKRQNRLSPVPLAAQPSYYLNLSLPWPPTGPRWAQSKWGWPG